MLPSVLIISTARQEKIKVRFKEFSAVGEPMDICRNLMTKMSQSKFITERSNATWRKKAFDWLFENSQNWVKVWEGRYDNADGQQMSLLEHDKPTTSVWGTKYE